MTKTSQQIEKEFVEWLKSNTGKGLPDWMLAIENSQIKKRNKKILWFKGKHSFGHMNSGLLTGIYVNNGNPVYVGR